MEFDDHRFLMQPFSDFHHDQVIRKSAQVGWSTLAIFRSFHLCNFYGLNIAHVLPTQNVVRDFVFPKVDPIINKNPAIRAVVGTDSKALKGIGGHFIYYRGSFTEREAITISTDLNVIDEYDRADQAILNTYDSRLQASRYGWRWRFSNPSVVGFGVDMLYQDSDQMHWFVKCHHCGHDWYMDWESDGSSHYVDRDKKIYACGKCHRELSREDRIGGRWVAKYPSRPRRGYWISQLMAPWVTAQRVIEQFKESSPDFFNNFVMGKAYTASDLIVDRAAILRACSPSAIVKTNVAMGVDNGVTKTWVLGNANGIFAHGRTESWDEIEELMLMYNAMVVIDPNPYPTTPKKLVDKYPNRVFICYFKESKDSHILQWGEKDRFGVVYADRTKSIDVVASEIANLNILFRETPYKLEDYIEQWGNIYRATEEEDDGRIVSKWLKKEGKLNDYALATVYWRIALSRIIGGFGGSSLVEPRTPKAAPTADVVMNGQLVTDLAENIEAAYEQDTGDWRSI